MGKIERLKREALESCRFRGHRMSRFTTSRGVVPYSRCKVCGKGVWIDPNLLPNGIVISGKAVALHCRGEVCTRLPCNCVECREC